MSRQTLDKLDLSILKSLSQNARKPYLEIARESGVSGAAIHQRIQRLNQIGTITGSECLIDPSAVGYETCAYVGMHLREPSTYNEAIEQLQALPEIVECHLTTGQYDIFIKLHARNNDHLLQLLQQIQSMGMARTETLISFKQVFKRPMPIED